jgi:hypothetical protein
MAVTAEVIALLYAASGSKCLAEKNKSTDRETWEIFERS